jgi:heme-degrading monooxygenase HmoA
MAPAPAARPGVFASAGSDAKACNERTGARMIAVIFEVWPAPGRKDDYLTIAASLRDELSQIDGFMSVERFQSLTDPDKLLSLSFWRDEDAVRAWRTQAQHRAGQAKGRAGIFADYRLRVAAVVRDYGLADRAAAPEDSKAVHDAQPATSPA